MIDEREQSVTQEVAPIGTSQEGIARTPMTQMAAWGGGTFVGVTMISLLSHAGATGIVIAGIAALVASRHGQQALEGVHDHLEFPHIIDSKITQQKKRKKGRTSFQRAFGIYPEQQPKAEPSTLVEGTIEQLPDAESLPVVTDEPDTLFLEEEAPQTLPFRRITLQEVVEHTDHNSYQVVLGRSLSLPNGRARRISFFKRHLKIIGASQKGKSSMAAYMIDVISETHDPWIVQFAILDLEGRTGELFNDLPHMASVRMGDRIIPLHARTEREVLEHLGYVCALVEYRYKLPLEQQEQLPLLVVYVEEFVFLKNFFKQKMMMGNAEEREKAKADFALLILRIKHLASRGLKVKVQLLICAQVDYRDEDLTEALANVTDGFAYCLKPSAAQAAGFFQNALLSENYQKKQKGQCVVETSEFNDTLLSPEYDLDVKLKTLQQTKKINTPIVVDVSTREETSRTEGYYMVPPLPYRDQTPGTRENNARLLTRLHHQALEHYQPGIGYRPLGELIGVGKDKAGDLLKDLKKWGFIEDDSDE